jgi:hypothetical protein
MDTETVTVLPKGEDIEITVQHDQSGSAYGITLSKDAYEQLRQHFVSGSLAFLGKILEEEMPAELRTWLMELNVKLANDRIVET